MENALFSWPDAFEMICGWAWVFQTQRNGDAVRGAAQAGAATSQYLIDQATVETMVVRPLRIAYPLRGQPGFCLSDGLRRKAARIVAPQSGGSWRLGHDVRCT
tara:strand:+ start:3950 stop:4258 length:309 start_codon:yes stop_codon:yes gene_type:complete